MRFIICFLFFCISLISCGSESKKAPTQIESNELSNIIDLTAGIKNIQPIRLSEIVDSVSFIPFETKPASLQGQGQKNIRFSSNYIFYYEMAYDWKGNYFGSIIKRGQGPFEEVDGGDLVYSNGHFYSNGSKFIEYDLKGKPTGKVRSLYAAREFGTNDFLRRGVDFTSVGENFVIFDSPTTLYYFNNNFETIASRVVYMPDSLPPNYTGGSGNYITFYKEKVLFYSFFNDTIFYITDTNLVPKWVVSFDEKLRVPTYAIFNSAVLYIKSIKEGRDDSELVQLTNHKHSIGACYETDKYIFFKMAEAVKSTERRGVMTSLPYIIYYDKATGKTTRVKGEGFEDDLLGFDYFYPQLGVYDEKLITYIWPFELIDFVKKSRESGREVNPQLSALSKQVKEYDNPILILFHLKK